jgi:hypothetical protein
MVIIPHPPYLPILGPCDFALFPKLKMKLKGRRFETVSNIQTDSQAVLDSIKENDFRVLLKRGKKMGSLYTFPRSLFQRRWPPKLSKLSQHFFFDLVDHISEVQNNLDRQINTNAGPILYRLSAQIHSPMSFKLYPTYSCLFPQ